ncbi:MAG: cysteine desulfurase [Nitrospirota bacterium]|nr:cysteine desulfurase [Nitrospirota bacterium]
MLFFDHINGGPPLPGTLLAMHPWLGRAANPQADHAYGRHAHTALEESRAQVAALLNARTAEILFGASGTELCNLAIKGYAKANRRRGRHLVLSAVEHTAVDRSARRLEDDGYQLTRVPVEREGRVNPAAVAGAVTDDTALVCLQLAAPETGAVQPVAETARLLQGTRTVLMVDAVAAAGRIPIDVRELGCDLLVISADSLWAPPGAAALFVRQGVRVQPEIDGGIQEGGRRGGRENLPAVIALGAAAGICQEQLAARAAYLASLEARLRDAVADLPMIHPTGPVPGPHRLPGHFSFLVDGAEGQSLLALLDAAGVAASSGSYCGARAMKASPVLSAMGYPPQLAGSGVVFSLGPENTPEEVDEGAKRLRECIFQSQKALSSPSGTPQPPG